MTGLHAYLSTDTVEAKDHVKDLAKVLPGYCIEDADRGLKALTAARQSQAPIADRGAVLLGATYEFVHAWLVKMACYSWDKVLPTTNTITTTNTTYKCLERCHFPQRDAVLLGQSLPGPYVDSGSN